MCETFIYLLDAAEDLSINLHNLVHLMRRNGLQARISFQSDHNFDWKAEVAFVKKRVEFIGGKTEINENYWEYEEHLEKVLSLNGMGIITLEGMIHLEESLHENFKGFDLLPGLMIIPESNIRTLKQVVYQELNEETPYDIDSKDHEGIVKIKKITEPSAQKIHQEGIKPPRLFLLHSDFGFLKDILEKNKYSKSKPTRRRSPVTAFIAQEISSGEVVWQNSWTNFRNLSDPNKLQTIGDFHFTLQRAMKNTSKGREEAVKVHEDTKQDPKIISREDFRSLFRRANKKISD